MSSYVEGHRHAIVTSDDVGPIIQIVTWFLMVVMIMSTMLRLLIRFTTIHVPGADDALISIAMLLGIGEVIAVSIAVNDGLGTRQGLLSLSQLMKIEKGIYAANMLYILTIAFAKASTLLLIYRLANLKSHLTTIRVVAGITVLWMLAALFGQAFQCVLPTPWLISSRKCFNIPSFWDGIGAVDILLDLFLIGMPALIVWDLHMHWGRKLVVISGFSTRLVLCAAQIIRLVYLKAANNDGSDFIYVTLGYTIATQCQAMLAVVSACVPALKPFMDRAASGLMGISFEDRGGVYDISGGGNVSYEMPSINKNGGGNSQQSKSRMSFRNGNSSAHQAQIMSSKNNMGGRGDNNEDYMIQKTMDWEVQYSDEARLNQKRESIEDRSENGSVQAGLRALPSARAAASHNIV